MSLFGGKGDKQRMLTAGEMNLIKSVFKTAQLPRLDEVKIADGVNPDGGAWTDSDYQINVGPDLYGKDLVIADPSTLVHEMTHVWQYYNGTLTKAHAAGAHIGAAVANFFGSSVPTPDKNGALRPGRPAVDLYKYDLDESWDDTGFEGQAQLVEHWFVGGKNEKDPRYLFIKYVIWEGDKASRRLSYTHLLAQKIFDDQIVETIGPQTVIAYEQAVPLSDSYLISLLQPRYAKNDVAGYGARARRLEYGFRTVPRQQALPLLTRLKLRNRNDKVATYFHDHLSTATRTKLQDILIQRSAGK